MYIKQAMYTEIEKEFNKFNKGKNKWIDSEFHGCLIGYGIYDIEEHLKEYSVELKDILKAYQDIKAGMTINGNLIFINGKEKFAILENEFHKLYNDYFLIAILVFYSCRNNLTKYESIESFDYIDKKQKLKEFFKSEQTLINLPLKDKEIIKFINIIAMTSPDIYISLVEYLRDKK